MGGRVENESDGDSEENETSFSLLNPDIECNESEVEHLRSAMSKVMRWVFHHQYQKANPRLRRYANTSVPYS